MYDQSEVLDADEVVLEAYCYLFPLVLMEFTRRSMVSTTAVSATRGPMNTLVHLRSFPDGDFKGVVRPNFDTLYSQGWFDVAATPWLVSLPAAENFVMFPVLDAFTEVVAAPGPRTSGAGAMTFAICRDTYTGDLPPGCQRISVTSAVCWLLGRVTATSPTDLNDAHRFQDAMEVHPLFPDAVRHHEVPERPSVPPLRAVLGCSGEEFFALGLSLLAEHGSHQSDWSILTRMARVGLGASPTWSSSACPPDAARVIATMGTEGPKHLRRSILKMASIVNGWQMPTALMGNYGNEYVRRAVVAMLGLGANPVADAVYPTLLADAEGQPLSGAHRYEMTFPADALPPVHAFWYLTAYDAEGFTVRNAIDRYAIGDRTGLEYAEDGSVTITLATRAPDGRNANWLPIPPGPTIVTMRLYVPGPSVLKGTWTPPPVRRVD